MPPRSASLTVPLPRGWTKIVRTATLHAISVAATALMTAWGRAATSRTSRQRYRAEVDRLQTEIALLTEELELKDVRWARLPARRRPHYGPVQRMRILELRAARGWTVAQTAKRFLVTEDTIASWIRRFDEGGERALVQIAEPVNIVPFRLDAMRSELACYAVWYNEHRPHQALGGRTPLEVYRGLRPANEVPRFEPRARWPTDARCAKPAVPTAGRRGGRLALVLRHVEGRRHLPVVELKRAA